jgi:hypothetical protein
MWGVVVGGHLCALGIVLHKHSARGAAAVQEPMQVVFLPLPKRVDVPSPEALNPPTSPIQHPVTRSMPATAPAANDTAITVPSAPRIDWDQEAETAAQAQVPAQRTDRVCEKNEMPDPRRPSCQKAPPSFEWNPEVPRVGMDGLFPYVRLGDTCVVGLGFFGCHEKMPANGKLFEEMKNPSRPASSVPDAPN